MRKPKNKERCAVVNDRKLTFFILTTVPVIIAGSLVIGTEISLEDIFSIILNPIILLLYLIPLAGLLFITHPLAGFEIMRESHSIPPEFETEPITSDRLGDLAVAFIPLINLFIFLSFCFSLTRTSICRKRFFRELSRQQKKQTQVSREP